MGYFKTKDVWVQILVSPTHSEKTNACKARNIIHEQQQFVWGWNASHARQTLKICPSSGYSCRMFLMSCSRLGLSKPTTRLSCWPTSLSESSEASSSETSMSWLEPESRQFHHMQIKRLLLSTDTYTLLSVKHSPGSKCIGWEYETLGVSATPRVVVFGVMVHSAFYKVAELIWKHASCACALSEVTGSNPYNSKIAFCS